MDYYARRSRLTSSSHLPKVFSSTEHIDTSNPNFIKWKRLHCCVTKLESVTQMTSHMSFFAVLAAVDLKINQHELNEPLIIAMVVTTSLLVSITMCVKFVASNILPSIQSIAELAGIEDIKRSPHEHLIYIINVVWIFANIICPCLFAIDLMLLVWLQFELISMKAVYAAAGIMMILLCAFIIFGIIFFNQKLPYKRRRNSHLNEIIKLTSGISGISESEYNYSRRRSSSFRKARRNSTNEQRDNLDDTSSICSSISEEDQTFSNSSSSTSSSPTYSSNNEEEGPQPRSSIENISEDMRTPLLKKKLVKRIKYDNYGSTMTIDPASYFYSSS